MSLPLPLEFIRGFPGYRAQAEFLARLNKKREDIAIVEIYEYFSRLARVTKEESNQIMNLELNIEREVSRPISSMLARINAAREKGWRVIFVSDSCLPKDLIRDMLLNVQVFCEGDGLYISSDIGLIKRSGKLFSHILKEEHCMKNEIVHYGDNWISDYFVPNFFIGIKAHHICL